MSQLQARYYGNKDTEYHPEMVYTINFEYDKLCFSRFLVTMNKYLSSQISISTKILVVYYNHSYNQHCYCWLMYMLGYISELWFSEKLIILLSDLNSCYIFFQMMKQIEKLKVIFVLTKILSQASFSKS